MSDSRHHGPVTDEDLVAFLDGQLDDERAAHVENEVMHDTSLSTRLDLLRRGDRPFAEAYDLLFDMAPRERLIQMLDEAREGSSPVAEEMEPGRGAARLSGRTVHAHTPFRAGWRQLAAAAILVAVFAGGLFSGQFVQLTGDHPHSDDDSWSKKGWRAAVAEYQSLFISQTLQNAGSQGQERLADIRSASNYLGIDLTVEKVSVAPLEFKRADVLKFSGKPLVQIAYLADGKTPVSFCIIKGKREPHELELERRLGLNIVYWDTEDFGFMVIGDVPKDELLEIARKLERQVS